MRATLIALGWAGLVVLAACGGSSGGGGGAVVIGPVKIFTTAELEPNDVIGDATPLPFGTAGVGDLPFLNEIDYWTFNATQDQVICIEIFAIRLDQDGWDAGGNAPHLTLLGPPGGATVELDVNPLSLIGSRLDADISCFRIPVTGTYYVCVQANDPAFASGRYAVLVREVPGHDDLQKEAEGELVTGLNDTPGTAEAIEPGVICGFYVNDELDYYSFQITEPSIVSFEMCSFRNGTWHNLPLHDGGLVLYDTDGVTQLAQDAEWFGFDPAIQYKFENPGTYYIAVDEFFFNNGSAPYFLYFELNDHGSGLFDSEPNNVAGNGNLIAYDDVVAGQTGGADDDWFKFVGNAGDMLELTGFTQGLGHQTATGTVSFTIVAPDGTTVLPSSFSNDGFATIRTILRANGTHYVRVAHDAGNPTPYCFCVEAVKRGTEETEPNTPIIEAEDLSTYPDRCGAGSIAAGDTDIYRVETEVNELVCIDIYCGNGPSFPWAHFNSDGWGATLQPQVEVGNLLPPWFLTDTTFNTRAWGSKAGLPTMTVCFIAPGGGSAIVKVSREPSGVIQPTDYYVIQQR